MLGNYLTHNIILARLMLERYIEVKGTEAD